MAVLKVAKLGNPVLRQVARQVDLKELTDPKGELQNFIDDMVDTMREEGGVGLAAPQVNRSIQVVVLEVAGNERYPEEAPIPVTALINPVLSDFSEERVLGWESCLSLSDFRGLVPRFASLTLNAYDREGNKVEKQATGFEAVVLQHEIDHLNGKVFLDRMEDLTQLAYLEEFEEFWVKKDTVP
ncbi:MAG: peptide deformylase [Nitrospina sp.]|jgi:peptide deformylase|nr:peptide deformylase [Nitrospina sp.]MBT3415781.1 peptide deformylase [Nitrospina sp.]MBT3857980.1 peptide deformylase [Nitrospina sp.]MBT4047244.1 peptide deformylase [Nitrospina sp.]MBT4390422.1 peptide deformylase [Nitrospina sp.]